MPLESLQTLQDLDITGPAGSEQDETQQDPDLDLIEGDENPARTFHHPPPAPQPASQPHPFEQPHPSPFYPPLLNSFGFDTANAIPIDPGLLDARFDYPAAPGPGGGGVAGFHQGPWTSQLANAAGMDSFMVSPTSPPQYNSSMPLAPGMSSFEPMVSTAWSMDSSLTSTSASRRPTLSSSLSVHGTSTPASSQSPSSPRKVSSGKIEPRATSREAVPIQSGVRGEQSSSAEAQPNKKRRQSSALKAPPKTSAERRSHRNNSSPGFTTPQVPIAPAARAAANPGDNDKRSDNKNTNNRKNDKNNKNNNSSSQQPTTTTTTTTTSPGTAPTQHPQASSSTTSSAQSQQQQQQPDPRARNREAANRCRAKSKVAVAELEATERAMGAEHEALTRTARSLREEVLALKNQLLMHGNCDDDVIQQYLANSARLVGSGVLGPQPPQPQPQAAGSMLHHRHQQQQQQQPLPMGPGVMPPGMPSGMPQTQPQPQPQPSSSSALGAGGTAGRGRQRDGRRSK